jgi:hypothetical protein
MQASFRTKLLTSMAFGAAGVALAGGAQAADLPTRKAAPAEYVRICNAFGAGFFYIPGTDTCLKVIGAVRGDYYYRPGAPVRNTSQEAVNLAGMVYTRDLEQFRGREYINFDARSSTPYGDLRGYASLRFSSDSLPSGPFGGGKIAVAGLPPGVKENAGLFQGLVSGNTYLDAAYVQWAGITAGVAHSFFDFYTHGYELGAYTVGTSDQPLGLLAYTAKFGGGFSLTGSIEDAAQRRIGNTLADTTLGDDNPTKTTAAYLTYGAENAPDFVANARYDAPWGAIQASGAAHEVNSAPIPLAGAGHTLPVGFTPSTKWGYAADLGVKINLDMLAKGDSFTAQATYANGGNDYTNAWNYWNGTSNVYDHHLSVSVPANDAFVLPNGTIGLVQSYGGFLGIQHYWVPQVRSSFFGSYLKINEPNPATNLSAGTVNAALWDIGGNVIWSPVKQLDLGAEVVYTNLALQGPKLATGGTAANGTTIPVPPNNNDWRARFRVQMSF